MTRPDDVLAFWLDEVGEKGWYKATDEVDAQIRDRFLEPWKLCRDGSYGLWLTYPSGTLAYSILLDQFPRNMFRGEAKAFSTDPIALAACKMAVGRDWDLKIDPPARQFFYLPLMHSENLSDQDRCVRLMKTRLADAHENLLHAKVHREIIRRFGRFPFRNEALRRSTTKLEAEFLNNGGYASVLRQFEAASS
jgi:uncharacterized protein (DUF924 family)